MTDYLSKVSDERQKQQQQWGDIHDDDHSPLEWAGLIVEYLGEYAKEGNKYGNDKRMLLALIKVGALAMSAYDAAERAGVK